MTESNVPKEERSIDECEKCHAPVYGWVEQRCCDGRMCACQGLPTTPCWCTDCWDQYDNDAKERAEEHENMMRDAP